MPEHTRILEFEVPLHVTGFWKICPATNPLETGSVGAGLLLAPYVKVKLLRGYRRFVVTLNDEYVNDLCVVRRVVENYSSQNLRGRIVIDALPKLGEGYALSAVVAIATSIGCHLNLKGENEVLEALKIAHISEVKCNTGLGDVIAISEGKGLEVRTKPGAPGVGRVVSFPVDGRLLVLGVVVSRALDTPTMLRMLRGKINKYGEEALKKLLEDPTLHNFLELSREFSKKTGMLTEEVEERTSFIKTYVKKGSIIGYYLKKNTLIIVGSRDLEDLVEEFKSKLGWKVYKLRIANEGFKICSDTSNT